LWPTGIDGRMPVLRGTSDTPYRIEATRNHVKCLCRLYQDRMLKLVTSRGT